MKDKKFVMVVFGITALVLVGGVYGAIKLSSSSGAVMSETSEAKISILERVYDFGEVSLNGGNIVKAYVIENGGSGPLTVANVNTSCMCTTAKVRIDGVESPAFGMHEKSSWKGTIDPGGKAEVVVTFDPAFHGPSGKGAITRVVQFETNDPASRQVELMMTGKVI